MDKYSPPETSSRASNASSVRDRQLRRQRRRQTLNQIKDTGISHLRGLSVPEWAAPLAARLGQIVRDALWYLLNRTPFLRVVGLSVVLFILMMIGSLFLSENIPPGVYAMNVPLSGLNQEEAAAALQAAWDEKTQITLIMDGETFETVSPDRLGLSLGTSAMIEEARAAGLTGIPFGVSIPPQVTVDYATAQAYLLELVDQVYIAPYEAGYEWRDGQIVGVPGSASRELDIALTLERLTSDPETIASRGRFELSTTATPPVVSDPSAYVEAAQRFIEQDFMLVGYDPFLNVRSPWQTTKEEMARWLMADVNGLGLRMNTFERFIKALNDRLGEEDSPRYLDLREAAAQVEEAIRLGNNRAFMRIRYLPTSYVVEREDNGFKIGRKTGLPFRLLEQANPGLNWNALSVGQTIRLPSRDDMLPEQPVPNKRIVVDLDALWLVAYEDDEMVFSWPISSGRNDAPTYPGIFQILSHTEVAYGSSFSLCATGTTNCAQWEMNWFMGIYEVFPGLMNGFHGNVLLPNGALLGGGGGAQSYTTFGCVMSNDDQAKQLYDWAELGTMVEIISDEFAPMSDLGRQADEYIRTMTST